MSKVNLPGPRADETLCRSDRLLDMNENPTAETGQGETGETRDTPNMPVGFDENPLLGTVIANRYKILGVIGEGGFGVVYEAEQAAPVRRRVALKVIKPGMDSRAVIARFEAERQALAVMDHPGIAKVLDGGETDRGLPYFVMELVKGEPITAFCDKNRLTIDQRVELMIDVSKAVQHAHTKGVIHRDLKPSNILAGYDADGHASVKVIDFGVAKALNQRLSEHTIFTDRGQMIGTPEYMSPEQAEMSGTDIDTRADIYSLGVVLYELLTGFRPFNLRHAAFHEIQRVVREVEPPRPSSRLSTLKPEVPETELCTQILEARRTDGRSLTGLLKRDLDWIVMKSLEKDRARRYETVDELAIELHRFRTGQTIQAGPPSIVYAFSKYARRNRVACVLFLTIFTSSVVILFSYIALLVEQQRSHEAELNRLALLRGSNRTSHRHIDFALEVFGPHLQNRPPKNLDVSTQIHTLISTVWQSILANESNSDLSSSQVDDWRFYSVGKNTDELNHDIQSRCRDIYEFAFSRSSLFLGPPLAEHEETDHSALTWSLRLSEIVDICRAAGYEIEADLLATTTIALQIRDGMNLQRLSLHRITGAASFAASQGDWQYTAALLEVIGEGTPDRIFEQSTPTPARSHVAVSGPTAVADHIATIRSLLVTSNEVNSDHTRSVRNRLDLIESRISN